MTTKAQEKASRKSESRVWHLFVPGRPQSKARPRKRRGQKTVYIPKKARDWQEAVGAAWFEEYGEPLEKGKEYMLFMRVYAADRRIGDVDNLLGAVMDAYIPLQKGKTKPKMHVFPNDRHVRLALVEKVFVQSPEDEGVEITVSPYEEGWFDLFHGMIWASYEARANEAGFATIPDAEKKEEVHA